MDDGAIIGVVLAIFGIIFIPFLIMMVIVIISNFKVYKKAGEDGWKCLVPYYNYWTECKFLGLNTNWVWIVLAAPFISSILEGIIEIGLFSLAASIILFYFNILRAISTAQSFGKDTGFGIGLFALPFVFYPILAFGKAEYIGPRPMKDMIFKDNNTTSTQNNHQQQPVYNQQIPQREEDEILDVGSNSSNSNAFAPQQSGQKFCTGCGAKLENGAKFCTSCGSKTN